MECGDLRYQLIEKKICVIKFGIGVRKISRVASRLEEKKFFDPP